MAAINAGGDITAAILSPQAWIPMSLLNSWANVGGGAPTAQYRLWLLSNEVEMIGEVSGGAITTGTLLNSALPSAYLPATAQTIGIRCILGAATAGPLQYARVTTGGQIDLQGIPSGTTRIAWHDTISLDA
jgi:hypothetical protein